MCGNSGHEGRFEYPFIAVLVGAIATGIGSGLLYISLLIVALTIMQVRPQPLSDAAMMLFLALGMGFDFFLLMYFGSLFATKFPNAKRAFCYCEAFTNIGLFCGSAAGILASRSSCISPAVLSNIYLGLIVASVALLMITAEQRGKIDRMMVRKDRDASVEKVAQSYGLTIREREIFEYLARGRSVPFISESLFIQKSTVETHRKHIYSKLNVHNRQELLDLIDSDAF